MQDQRTEHEAAVLDLELRCPVEPRILGIVRCFVRSLALEMGFSQEEIEQIEMSVDEACANVVRHAYKHLGVSPDIDDTDRRNPPHVWKTAECDKALSQCHLVIRVSVGENLLRIQIIDHGIGLERMPLGAGSVEEYIERGASGGLGVYIIRNFMDEVVFESSGHGEGTALTMVKYLRAHASN